MKRGGDGGREGGREGGRDRGKKMSCGVLQFWRTQVYLQHRGGGGVWKEHLSTRAMRQIINLHERIKKKETLTVTK